MIDLRRWRMALLSLVVLIALSGCFVDSSTATPTLPSATPGPSSLQLFETPRDGPAPVLNAIHQAQHSVDVEVYELLDPGVISALIADQTAGTQVRVILNKNFPSGTNQNSATFQQLNAAGVAVQYADPDYTFTHEKAIVVDAGQSTQAAVIMTLNLSPGYLGEPDPQGMSLNFGLIDSDSNDINQIEAIFNADWLQQPYSTTTSTDLVISPINSRTTLLSEIQNATHSIHFFAQEFEDKQIIAAMVAAAQRGVEVKGLLAPNISGNIPSAAALTAAGGQARYLAQPYEHAKATIVDGSIVYIGSINYTATSLDKNRELGILTQQSDIATQMETEFAKFWAQGSTSP